jgi:hypothetical protein
MNALMLYGVAAGMIIFIATIVAATILGTVLAVMDLVERVRRASAANARAERSPANTLV